MATATRCNGLRRDGQPCGSVVVLPSGYCLAHNPVPPAAPGRGDATTAATPVAAVVPAAAPVPLQPVFVSLVETYHEFCAGRIDAETADVRGRLGLALASLHARLHAAPGS